MKDYANARAADVIDDVAFLEMLDEERLLTPSLSQHLARRQRLVAELAEAIEQFRNPKRKAGASEYLLSEPTSGRDEVAVCVLDGELSSVLMHDPVTIGEAGQGPTAKRFVWDPREGALGFLDWRAFAGMRRNRELGDRLVVLDGGKGSGASFADLFGLITSSPSRVRHVHDLAKNVIRGTTSLALLELWLKHPSNARDPERARLLRQQIIMAEKAAAAE